MLVPLAISSASAALLAILLLRPYSASQALHAQSVVATAPHAAPCRVETAPQRCAEAHLAPGGDAAYLLCRGRELWRWPLDEPGAQPAQLAFAGGPQPVAATSFAVTPAHGDANTTLLLVAEPDGVSVWAHRGAAALLFHSRIATPAARIAAEPSQWSPPVPGPAGTLRLPSFLFLAPDTLPLRPPVSALEHAGRMLRSSPAADVHMHIARANRSVVVAPGAEGSWSAPLLAAWHGGGAPAGRNSTTPVLFVAHASVAKAEVREWEEHWVRGIRAGIAETPDPYAIAERVRSYTPAYVSLRAQPLSRVPSALASDAYGRLWLAESLDSGAVLADWAAWLEHGEGARPPRPRGRVSQVTYVHRIAGAVLHPWQLARLGELRQRGLWLPKETFVRPAWASGTADAHGDEAEWLPSVVTGIAVDAPRAQVLLVSAWDERGVALCPMPASTERTPHEPGHDQPAVP